MQSYSFFTSFITFVAYKNVYLNLVLLTAELLVISNYIGSVSRYQNQICRMHIIIIVFFHLWGIDLAINLLAFACSLPDGLQNPSCPS